jgi:hypothetical protein
MFSPSYSRSSCLYSVLTIVETSYLYSVLTTLETSCLCSVLFTAETSYLYSVLTTVKPHVYVHFNYCRNLLSMLRGTTVSKAEHK